jgi:putative transposase
LVGKAKDTGRGIKLEQLDAIRDRITVRKAQRADLGSWGFHQLEQFITYKAALAGVHVALVDPRNTSRQCPGCQHISKRNRPTRDWFRCERCGFAGPADHIGAVNIAARAAVIRPHAA